MPDLKIEASPTRSSTVAFGAQIDDGKLLLPPRTAQLVQQFGIQTSSALLAVSGSLSPGFGDLLGMTPDQVKRHHRQLAELLGEPSDPAPPPRFSFGARDPTRR